MQKGDINISRIIQIIKLLSFVPPSQQDLEYSDCIAKI